DGECPCSPPRPGDSRPLAPGRPPSGRTRPCRRPRSSRGTECEWRCAWSWPLDVLSQLVLRRRHPPRDLLLGLLKLARQVGVPPLEVLLLFLKPQNLGTQPPELAAQRFDVGAVAVGLRRRPRRRCRHPSDRDLRVGRPVLLSSRRGIPGPLDASAHLMALLERDGAGRDFPLMGLVPVSASSKRSPIWSWSGKIERVGSGSEPRRDGPATQLTTARGPSPRPRRDRDHDARDGEDGPASGATTHPTAGRAVLEDHAFRSVPPSGAPDLLPLPQGLRQRRLHPRACAVSGAPQGWNG